MQDWLDKDDALTFATTSRTIKDFVYTCSYFVGFRKLALNVNYMLSNIFWTNLISHRYLNVKLSYCLQSDSLTNLGSQERDFVQQVVIDSSVTLVFWVG